MRCYGYNEHFEDDAPRCMMLGMEMLIGNRSFHGRFSTHSSSLAVLLCLIFQQPANDVAGAGNPFCVELSTGIDVADAGPPMPLGLFRAFASRFYPKSQNEDAIDFRTMRDHSPPSSLECLAGL